MIFQSYALWPHMTVAENVAYGLKLRKIDRDDDQAASSTPSSPPRSLAPLAERYPGELSGGQQQRVALARALIVEPETLLLDEPLSNLDANLREEMRFEVRRLHDEYRYTTVYVTHDQSEAMTTADVIAVMNAGKIEQAGSPEEIYDRPRSEFVARFIGIEQRRQGQGARRQPHLVRRRARCAAPAASSSPGARRRGRRSASTSSGCGRRKPQATENVVPATVVRQVFLGISRDYMVEVAGRHAAARGHVAGREHRAGRRRSGCICRRSAAGCLSG